MQIKEKVWMALNGEFLKEMEEKAKRKAEEEAAKPPKKKRPRKKTIGGNPNTAGTIEILLSWHAVMARSGISLSFTWSGKDVFVIFLAHDYFILDQIQV